MLLVVVLQIFFKCVFLICGEWFDGCGAGGGGVAGETLFEVLLPEDVWGSVEGCEEGEADDGREVEGEGFLLERACQLLSSSWYLLGKFKIFDSR